MNEILSIILIIVITSGFYFFGGDDKSILISIFAILLTTFKDFIIPFFNKPKLEFFYEDEEPYRRNHLKIGKTSKIGNFLRFKVKNKGNLTALKCRCKIVKILKNGKKFGDYEGIILNWASRPTPENPLFGERLNICVGETEFLDLVITIKGINNIILRNYYPEPIGIKNTLPNGKYIFLLLFTGDNFDPYKLSFEVEKKGDFDDVKLKLKEVHQ